METGSSSSPQSLNESRQSSSFQQLNTSSSESSSFCEVSTAQTKVPLNVHVSYDKEVLAFKICCSKIPEDPFSYIRHYLLLDVNRENLPKMQMVIQCYYQKMNVGDLLMIKSISRRPLTLGKWIEKTRDRKDIAHKIKIKQAYNQSTLVESIDNACKETAQYDTSLVCISIFLDFQPPRGLLKDIEVTVANSRHVTSFKLFCLMQSYLSRWYAKSLRIEDDTDLTPKFIYNLENQMSEFFENLSRIRLMRLEIKLQCLSGSFVEHSLQNNHWVWEGDRLVKAIKGLQSHVLYSENIRILRMMRSIDIFIEISYVSMKGWTYKTFGCLKICPYKNQGKCTSIQLQSYSQNAKYKQLPLSAPVRYDCYEEHSNRFFKRRKDDEVTFSTAKNLGGGI